MPSALVTGGAVRLGKSFACHLAIKGYDIALHYGTSETASEETLAAIRKMGVRAKAYPCDFRNLAEVEELIRKTADDFSDLSMLVNSASNFIPENLENTRTQTLTDTLQINLMTPYLLMREYKKHVNKGMIINIIDQRILKNIPSFAAYSVSKSGLAHLTQLAAIEWGTTIRVNGIAPGLILPPPWETEAYLKKEAPSIPMADHGCTEDLLKGLDYLIESTFVNGEILFIDGGESKNPGYTFKKTL